MIPACASLSRRKPLDFLRIRSNSMSLKVNHCVPEDARELAEVYLATYGVGGRFHATFYRVPDEILLKGFEEDFRKEIELQNQPIANQEAHILKVTDTNTNKIIAFAIWKYLPHGYNADEDTDIQVREQPEGTDVPLLRHVYSMTGKLRSEHPGRHEAHWCKSRTGNFIQVSS